VRGVLEGESDTTVQLDHLAGDEHEGVTAHRAGQRRRDLQVR
jgi:hypothetical protein